jgi:hypothetical protein
MTFVGKLFVLVNLAFSMMMATAALALYTSGLDYGPETKKDAQPKPPARVTALRTEITDVLSTWPAVQGSWRNARFTDNKEYRGLLIREERREGDRKWYSDELKSLRAPLPGKADGPVKMIQMGPDHLPILDEKTQRPILVDALDRAGQPLMPLATYMTQIEAVRKENEGVQDSLQAQIKEGIRLTELLTGSADRRGLRQMLVDERVKREGVVAEYNSLRPLFINTAVDSQLIRQRVEAMKEQIEQLKAYLRMKHKVDVVAKGR